MIVGKGRQRKSSISTTLNNTHTYPIIPLKKNQISFINTFASLFRLFKFQHLYTHPASTKCYLHT